MLFKQLALCANICMLRYGQMLATAGRSYATVSCVPSDVIEVLIVVERSFMAAQNYLGPKAVATGL